MDIYFAKMKSVEQYMSKLFYNVRGFDYPKGVLPQNGLTETNETE